MKLVKSVILLFLFFSLMSMADDKKRRIVFFDDSITQAGANKSGYIRRLNTFFYSEKHNAETNQNNHIS